MKSILKTTTVLGIVAALAACEGQVAGDLKSSSSYGGATTSNLLAQAVSLQGNLLAELQAQFRASAPDMINFAFNQATLDAEARAALDQQAAWIRANPAIKFRVYGHTDLVGSNSYNQRLGLRRAQAAVNYLIARTVTQIVGFDRRFMGYDFDGKVAHNIYQGYIAADAE